jgi:sugar/nucleoside kinase (ribokinase family)
MQVREWVAVADFVFFSEEDTSEPVELAERIAAQGVGTFLTRGYRGALLFTRNGRREFPAHQANATDPTGAGDCFATAFLVRYAETGDIDAAVPFALAAGALAVERPGRAGVPTRAQIERRLATGVAA